MDAVEEVCLRADVVAIDHDAVVCIAADLVGKALVHPEGIVVDEVAYRGLVPATVALVTEDDTYPDVLALD